MKRQAIELTVGIFMVIGILCLAYLSVRLGNVDLFGGNQYQVHAQFEDIGGLREGAVVAIAGVTIGKVTEIRLNKDFYGEVVIGIAQEVSLSEDTFAAIKTRGLIGEKYIALSPGGAEKNIAPGGTIRETQPAVDLENILSEFVHGTL